MNRKELALRLLEHLQGRHNQKSHGNKYGSAAAIKGNVQRLGGDKAALKGMAAKARGDKDLQKTAGYTAYRKATTSYGALKDKGKDTQGAGVRMAVATKRMIGEKPNTAAVKKVLNAEKRVKSLVGQTGGNADTRRGEYAISKAKYAKGKLSIKAPSKDMWATDAGRLLDVIGGKYSHRENGFIVSPSQAEKFIDLFNRGAVAYPMSKRIEFPEA